MKQIFPDWLTPTVCHAFVIAVPTLMNPSSVAAEELTYWVSEHFSETPNVNYDMNPASSGPPNGTERQTEPILPFRPRVADLSDLNWSYETDGDVRLCFDNRPLHLSKRANLLSDPSKKDWCAYYKSQEHPNSPNLTTDPYRGVHIRRLEGEKFACEAVFTMMSLSSVLSGQPPSADSKQKTSGPTKIFPYWSSSMPFLETKGIESVMTRKDKIFKGWNSGGHQYFFEVDLRETWECLHPYYEEYWKKVILECQAGISKMRKNSDVDEIYTPILTEAINEIKNATSECKSK